MKLTKENIYKQLGTLEDPELGIDLVSLGLIYEVKIKDGLVFILMTVTSPGCPLIGVFDGMIRESLEVFEGLDIYKEVDIELTFDPPWVTDMMSEEAKAELGID